MKKIRDNIRTDYQRIGSYKGVSIYARTFWGTVDFALFNTIFKNENNKNSWSLSRIKNSSKLYEILADIDNRLDDFYKTRRYNNEPSWGTRWNPDLVYFIKYLEDIE